MGNYSFMHREETAVYTEVALARSKPGAPHYGQK